MEKQSKLQEQQEGILFREVTGTLPSFQLVSNLSQEYAYDRGKWFYVELHVSCKGTYGPAAIGTISTYDDGKQASMDNLFVQDHLRGMGLGRKLIIAAGERWPDLSWVGTLESHEFHERLVAQGIARKGNHGHYEFLSAERKVDRQFSMDEVNALETIFPTEGYDKFLSEIAYQWIRKVKRAFSAGPYETMDELDRSGNIGNTAGAIHSCISAYWAGPSDLPSISKIEQDLRERLRTWLLSW
jgi:GNAT superfamily N-acetyltransferase